MSTEAYLALWLDAPLMAWGHDSFFNHRHTAQWPTKSGIVGLLAAARGVDKLAGSPDSGLPDEIQLLADTHMMAIRFPRRTGSETLPIGLLNDFHTVGGGFDPKRNPDDRLRVPPKAKDRSPRPDPDVTHRHYLEDARFGVILRGMASTLEPCARALRNPHWGIWFGRKCCLPAAPVLAGFRSNFSDAWRDLLTTAGLVEGSIESFDRCEELAADSPAPDLRSSAVWSAHSDAWNDQPVRFGPQNHDRAFRRRRIVEIKPVRLVASST